MYPVGWHLQLSGNSLRSFLPCLHGDLAVDKRIAVGNYRPAIAVMLDSELMSEVGCLLHTFSTSTCFGVLEPRLQYPVKENRGEKIAAVSS